MALFAPSESPAIVVKEVDLSGVVPNVQSTTGAIVGNFRWGPVEEATAVDTEGTLASKFGTPTDLNAVDFLSAAYFLKYSSSLQVVRMVDSSAVNSRWPYNATAAAVVKNSENFNTVENSLDSDANIFIAKYPGSIGNSLAVAWCPPSGDSANAANWDSAFENWTYKSSFDGAPRTSSFAASVNASNDEIHLAVIDQDGLISGTRGTVLETFPYVSLASNARLSDGTNNFIRSIVNNRSEYIWMPGFGVQGSYFDSAAGTEATSGINFANALLDNAVLTSLDSGANSGALGTNQYIAGFDAVSDKDTITVDFLIAPGVATRGSQIAVVNNLVSIAQGTRKDCVVVASPAREDIIGVNGSTAVTSAITTANGYTKSSYLIVDNNYLKVYDKYNDKYVYIPAASSTAGVMAASDLNAAPWFSPAGSRRGQYLGVTSLSYTPTKSQRDALYKASINPIANIPGEGILLFGDKTALSRPSAFDRINVRRLFLTIERAIALAARNVLFEFNDEFTRAEFVNIVEPFLREIQGRRGITDFRVVCDETNNTPAVIDRNEFIASVFIKPARSINYVTLNFVAVRTGVDFDEFVGTV